MGRHSSTDTSRRLAAWPIVAGVAVVLAVGLTIAYFAVLNSGKSVAACTGKTILQVTASPGAFRAVEDAARSFESTGPVARSTCVSVSVKLMDGTAAEQALAGGWAGQPSPAPALWVVDSAADLAALDASNSAMTAGHSDSSLATSPVVLAVRSGAEATAMSWASLTAAPSAAGPILAISEPNGNRASGYALQSLIAASGTGRPVAPIAAVEAAAVTGSASLFARLARAESNIPASTGAALEQLAGSRGGVMAVPVIESELATFNAGRAHPLASVYPTGAAVRDEIFAVPLTAPWVTATMSDAAAAFDAFLGDAKGLAVFTADHLRTTADPTASSAARPPADPIVTVNVLPDATIATRAAIGIAWAAAAASAGTAGASSTQTTVTASSG